MSFSEKFQRFKGYIPRFIGLYTMFIVLLSILFILSDTPLFVLDIPDNVIIQPFILLIVAMITPLLLTGILIEYYPKLKKNNLKFIEYSPYGLIGYIGYLLFLFFDFLSNGRYINPDSYSGSSYISPILMYGILTLIPLLFAGVFIYQRRIHSMVISLEPRIFIAATSYLILQLIINLLFFGTLIILLPNKIDLGILYGAMDVSSLSTTDINLLILTVSLFVAINILINILIGWKWIQREIHPPRVQYWILAYFCFGLIDGLLNLVIILIRPEITKEAFFPWMGLVIMPVLDFFLVLIAFGAVFLTIMGKILFPNPVGDAITFFYFMAASVLMISLMVILPLIPPTLFYIGVVLRKIWERRIKQPEKNDDKDNLMN
jgi:hypothetical protein